jgi:hypothetical protein
MIIKILSRKTFHDYAIPIFATIALVIILIALLIMHQYAVSSVNNLASTNPLIVSDDGRLVSRDEANNPIINDEEVVEQTTQSSESSPQTNDDTPVTTAPSASRPPAGGSNGGTTPTTPNTPNPPAQAQFAVGLGSIQHSRNTSNIVTGLLGLLLGCSVDHQFKIAVNGSNGPGVVKYRWVRSTGGGGDIEQKALPAGTASVDLTHSWTTSSSGEYWVSLEVYAPTTMEKKFTFRHQC